VPRGDTHLRGGGGQVLCGRQCDAQGMGLRTVTRVPQRGGSAASFVPPRHEDTRGAATGLVMWEVAFLAHATVGVPGSAGEFTGIATASTLRGLTGGHSHLEGVLRHAEGDARCATRMPGLNPAT
jgi:hypothetical protein